VSLLDGVELVASMATLLGQPVFHPSRYPFEDRVAAAAGAGFTGIGMSVDDFDVVRAGGLSEQDVREILGAHGIVATEVEGFGEWLAVGAEQRDEARRKEERVYALADVVGAPITNVGVFTDELPPFALMVERYGALCDRAREHGLTVGLEPVVLGPLRTVALAHEVAAAAARPNGGVLVDSYHFFRAGEPVEALRAIPPEQIVMIHLADAAATLEGALWDDCLSRREIPGHGGLPIVEFLVELDRIGAQEPLGIEIFSAQLWPLPIDEVLRRVAEGTRDLLDAARAAAA